jgi:tetratricopeptide (TPR) repeat protein
MQQAVCPVLIGRETHLLALSEAMAAARRGSGRACALGGEAGMGKTRLAIAAREQAQARGMATMWGSCSQAELSLPYLPFLEAVGNYLAGADLEVVCRQLASLAGDVARIFPQLPSQPPPVESVEPLQIKVRLFEGILALLKLAAGERGLLIVIEDVHWADSSTRELLDYLSRRLANLPVALLMTFRSDELHRRHPLQPLVGEWRRGSVVTLLELDPFSAAEVAGMVRAILQVSTVGEEFRDLLHTRSEGNPFIVEELLRASLDRGDIFRTETGWDRKPMSELQLPRKVKEVIIARLERLSQVTIDVLRAAAVLGRTFDYEPLVAMSRVKESGVQSALQEGVQQQLLLELPDRPGRYRFRHDLTREAVYDDLIAPTRLRLHRAAARTLAERSGTPAIDVCRHLVAAGDWDQAVPICLKAAEDAEAACSYGAAAELYEQLLPYVSDAGQRGRVLVRLCGVLNDSSQWARSSRYLEEGIGAAERAGDPGIAAELRLLLAVSYANLFGLDRCLDLLERLRRDLEPSGPSKLLASVYGRISTTQVRQLNGPAALEAARMANAVAAGLDDDRSRIYGHLALGGALSWTGQVDEALSFQDLAFDEAVRSQLYPLANVALGNGIEMRLWHFRFREALEQVDLYGRITEFINKRGMWYHEGMVCWRLGQLEKALEHYKRTLESHRLMGSTNFIAWDELLIAMALADLGRLDDAKGILNRHARVPTTEDRVHQAWVQMRVGLDSGDLAAALAATEVLDEAQVWPLPHRRFLGDMAVEVLLAARNRDRATAVVASAAGQPPQDPYQLRMEGRLALAAGDAGRARELLAQAAEFWREVGGQQEETRTLRALAQAKAQLGDLAGAAVDLRRVLASAHERGAALEESRAREQLEQIGIQTAPKPDDVRAALEDLDQLSALAGSRLSSILELASGRGAPAAELRNLLITSIRELQTLPASADAEAARVLLDRYVTRAGSHEVVAERLHLSRRTYYRRLDHGLALLAERLTSRTASTASSFGLPIA